MAMVMLALSPTVYEIFVYQKQCQNIDLEIELQVQRVRKRNLSISTRNIGLHIDDFSEL